MQIYEIDSRSGSADGHLFMTYEGITNIGGTACPCRIKGTYNFMVINNNCFVGTDWSPVNTSHAETITSTYVLQNEKHETIN